MSVVCYSRPGTGTPARDGEHDGGELRLHVILTPGRNHRCEQQPGRRQRHPIAQSGGLAGGSYHHAGQLNTQPDIRRRDITGVELNINSSQITRVSLASSSADLIDIPSQSSVANLGLGALSHWTAATLLSELTLTTTGGGAATQAIIGAPNGSDVHSNANGSLTGSTKQPHADQTAVFTLELSGTDISVRSITGAEIAFGTNGTNYLYRRDQRGERRDSGTGHFLAVGRVGRQCDSDRSRDSAKTALKS